MICVQIGGEKHDTLAAKKSLAKQKKMQPRGATMPSFSQAKKRVLYWY